MVINILGKTMLIFALLFVFPICINFIYGETQLLSFVYPMAGLFVLGLVFSFIKPADKTILAKEGIVIVALSWLILSLVGAVPFVISKTIPNYIDALFETASGLSTTGASVCTDVESFPKSILFWRMFTHFIGGMGVLVFVLAIIPKSRGSMHIFRAESPGPTSSKLVSKLSYTARILYAIYIVMTLVEALLLMAGGMPLFDSVVHSFSTAGTGGFSIKNNGLKYYNSVYIEVVVSIFMFLFSINFNVYYMILIGNVKKALKSEEFIGFTVMVASVIVLIALNLYFSGMALYKNLGIAFKDALFQTTAISSTTGMSNGVDFDQWPTFSKSLLLMLTIIGACAGSTGGGIKLARIMILFKSGVTNVRKMVAPRSVKVLKFEGETIDETTMQNTHTFFSLWFSIVIISVLILSLDGFDLLTNLSATFACIGNVGPGFQGVGPLQNYSGFSWFSKLILCFDMLAGRLELFPMLILLRPATWKKG